ncbi:hypothetical protein [Subtercola boreus]|nr:hypothetical protein [Subtercola boreus]
MKSSRRSPLALTDGSGLTLLAGRNVLSRSVISSPVWKRVTSTVTVLMVGAAVIVGVSIGLSGPAVSPVTPSIAAAAAGASTDTGATDPVTTDPGAADATTSGPAPGRTNAPRGANGGPRNGRR